MTAAARTDSSEASSAAAGDPVEHISGEIYRFHLLIEIANFQHLRRAIGCERSELLAGLVSERVGRVIANGSVAIIGRTQIACSFRDVGVQAIDRRIAAIDKAIGQPFALDDQLVTIELTYGGASAPAAHVDDVEIIEQAESALAEARVEYRVVTHTVPPRTRLDTIQLARELDAAIDREELVLHYQPKVHVRRQEITSAEALVRWRHPTRGLVMPNDFIPVAEECQLIDRMTLWTIRRAIADQRALATRGHDLRLFINIAGQLLADTAFVREACDLVGGSDAKLGFEITETSVIRDPASAIANLQIFADFGITIAIDDYGAGLSSLAYLKQLPARELKIDKLFVTQLTSSNRDPLIVRSTIDLAHALEMEVVAEGVETHAALALLTVMGCDMVQGFLISRPVVFDSLVQYLEDGRHRAPAPDPLAAFGGFAAHRRLA
ncbi:EAL domain-containing protein (putative c-di-GMP-specific phosphodiesterase class I) [Sphingomonas insulae]|uniref:EAL domain-containing protein n=1 Tax=Sphingomonas insulae TaxID=424800 RepID=A0ABN1HZ21_9SPHN|nr:EAL domain-containing protein [Sphingomonas insulae]NIJ29463.1 EAL domain-containing protein (putative c-di-GMP-specific phosphodiesterase class I) [Sphingomonas insulae]